MSSGGGMFFHECFFLPVSQLMTTVFAYFAYWAARRGVRVRRSLLVVVMTGASSHSSSSRSFLDKS